jgi:hypothetical protein
MGLLTLARSARASLLTTSGMEREPERYYLDVRGETAARQVRLLAGILAGVAGVWLGWVSALAIHRAFALAAIVFSVLWLRSTLRAPKSSAPQSRGYLELDSTGLTMVTHSHTEQIVFDNITAVRMDHDRIAVVIERKAGPEIVLEAAYQGAPPEQLAARIHNRWLEWQAGCNSLPCG